MIKALFPKSNRYALVSFDQYFHSASSFLIPFVLASLTNKSEFSDISLFFIILSFFIGIANASIVFLMSYLQSGVLKKNTINKYLFFYMIAGTAFFYLLSSNKFMISNEQLVCLFLYGAFFIHVDITRKYLYLKLETGIHTFLLARTLGLIIFMCLVNYQWEIAALFYLLPALLEGARLQSSIKKTDIIFKWEVKHLKQLQLFLVSFILANIPVYLFAAVAAPHFLAELRIYQLIAGAGTIALLPIEILIIKKYALNERREFNGSVQYPLKIIAILQVILIFMAGIVYLIVSKVIDWFDFNVISMVLLQVQWAASVVIFLATVRLRSENNTKRQFIASVCGCMMGICFGIAQYYSMGETNQIFAAYLALISIVTAIILTLSHKLTGTINR